MISPAAINREYGNIDLHLLDQLLKNNIPQGKLLDAGCGEGRNLKYFITSPEYEVYGLDNNPAALRMACMLYKNKIQTVEVDIQNPPFKNDSFDTIFCINVLHHLKNKQDFEKAFSALAGILKEDGVLFIRTLIVADEKLRSEVLCTTPQFLKSLVELYKLKEIEPLRLESFNNQTTATLVLQRIGTAG